MTTAAAATKTPTPRTLPLDLLQKAAAEAQPGPIIILGGPGVGKTHTLFARIKALVNADVHPYSISYITFSSRAADQARRQLGEIFPDGDTVEKLFIGTFHSFASNFLRQHGASRIGRSPHYSLWDHDQAKEVITAIATLQAEKDGEENPERESRGRRMTNHEANEFLQWLSLNRSKWAQEPAPPKDAWWHELLALYNREKIRQNSMDLDDLVPLAVQALEADPKIRAVWSQIRSRHLLVDEFQDISPIQYRLLRLVTGPTKSIAIATDPNQSIYGWRGAESRMLKTFRLDYPEAEINMLRLNHRSTATLVEMAETLTSNEETEGLSTTYQSAIRPRGEEPVLLEFRGDADRMTRHVLEAAERMVENGEREWEDLAMIYRRRNAKNRLITNLAHKFHIPYHILGDVKKTGLNTPARVINLLSSVANPRDVAAFAAAATVEPDSAGRGLNPNAAARINALAQEEGINLIEASEIYVRQLRPRNKIRNNLEYVIQAWRTVNRALQNPEVTLEELCRAALSVVDRDQLEKYVDGEHEGATQILAICRASARLPDETPDRHLCRFLENLKSGAYPDLQDQSNDNPLERRKGLTLSTIHAAKGLQWPVVWVMDATDGIIPGSVNPDDPNGAAEEERIFYVASTRAVDRLYYCHADGGGRGAEARPSRYLEILAEFIESRQTLD